jgi:hypothetical protein
MWNSLAWSSVRWSAFHQAVPAQRFLASAQQFVFSHAYQVPGSQRPHNLPSELIVSLTSYPRRFPILDFAIRSLLNQTVRPDRVILWLAEDDVTYLPSAVRRLAGLEIRTCRDLRSFKKLVPLWRNSRARSLRPQMMTYSTGAHGLKNWWMDGQLTCLRFNVIAPIASPTSSTVRCPHTEVGIGMFRTSGRASHPPTLFPLVSAAFSITRAACIRT